MTTTSRQAHTPGPWIAGRPIFVDDEDMATIAIRQPNATPIIAEVLLLNSDEAEMEANARLIAKAPELHNEIEHASTRYQNLIEYLRGQAESDAWAADLLAQVEAADESARALLAEIAG